MANKIYFDMSFDDYAAIEALSNSKMNQFRMSPLTYRWSTEHPDERSASAAMRMGRALHCLTLQQDLFNKLFYALPKLDLRKSADKAMAQDLEVINRGKEALKEDEWERVFAMANAINNNDDAAGLLQNTTREVSLVWSTKDIVCKARLDAWNLNKHQIIDIKTTDCSAPQAFAKSMYNYGYYRQAAWYLRGVREQGNVEPTSFYFIAVESSAPYQVSVYKVEPGIIELANVEIDLLLEKYRRCITKNEWPGYVTGIRTIGLPAWAIDDVNNFIESGE